MTERSAAPWPLTLILHFKIRIFAVIKLREAQTSSGDLAWCLVMMVGAQVLHKLIFPLKASATRTAINKALELRLLVVVEAL